MNSRLDTIQAVVLKAKLARLPEWNERRRAAAARYGELLADVPGVRTPASAPGNVDVWHLYVVRVPNRDAVLHALHEAGIGAGIHYPYPLHLTRAYAGLGYQRGDFPVSERAADEILSLPLFPHITDDQQQRVVRRSCCCRGLRAAVTAPVDIQPSADETGGVASRATRAFGWSFLNTIVSRLGTLAIGIVLARVLGPEAFGTFAVATVAMLAILSFNELGVSLAIVRWQDDPATIAPTVNTISVLSSLVLFGIVFADRAGVLRSHGRSRGDQRRPPDVDRPS